MRKILFWRPYFEAATRMRANRSSVKRWDVLFVQVWENFCGYSVANSGEVFRLYVVNDHVTELERLTRLFGIVLKPIDVKVKFLDAVRSFGHRSRRPNTHQKDGDEKNQGNRT